MFTNVSRFFFHKRYIASNGKVVLDDSKIIADKTYIFLNKKKFKTIAVGERFFFEFINYLFSENLVKREFIVYTCLEE